jgi:hypothetical protein
MNNQDVYQTIYNPMRILLKHELWVRGKVVEWTGTQTIEKHAARCVKVFRSKQKADEAIQYYKDIQSFKEQANV